MPRHPIDAREAALILRGVVGRVDDEQQKSEPEGELNYIRGVDETVVATDTTSATQIPDTDLSLYADTDGDEWGFGYAE